MLHWPFHLPFGFFSSTSSNVNSTLFTFYSIILILYIQIVSSLTSSVDDRAIAIVKSIDEYLCHNYLLTCFFRQRHHPKHVKSVDQCKSLLILHSCLHHDIETRQICSPSAVDRAKFSLRMETPSQCFTSSVYKNFYAQHLRSIAPSSAVLKCPTDVLLSVLISLVIRIRACY